MGSNMARVYPLKEFPERDLFNCSTDNGYVILNDIQVNADVLCEILCLVPNNDLVFNCRLVCKNWCDLIDSEVWHEKLNRSRFKNISKLRKLPWHCLFKIISGDFLDRNLLKNSDGIDKFRDWTIVLNGGNRMIVENPPCGTEEPSPRASCFVTSYDEGSKEQILDLTKLGASPYIMDIVQPKIIVSEWFAGRFDCKAVFRLEIFLLDQESSIVDSFSVQENCGGDFGSNWRQVSHVFENYKPGVRFIRWIHAGKDSQFWAGHYGSKFTGGELKLVLE